MDPGTNFNGYCIVDYQQNKVPEIKFIETQIVSSGISKHNYMAHLYGDRFAKIYYIGLQYKKLLELYKPRYVVSESPYLGRFPASFAALTEVLSIYRNVLSVCMLGTPLDTIDPSSVKCAMGVKGTSSDKNKMSDALSKLSINYNEYSLSELDEHSVDAMCVNLTMANRLGLFDFEVYGGS